MKNLSPAKRLSLVVALAMLVVVLGWRTNSAEAFIKTFYWERFDVDIIVLENGDLDITEDQTIVFSGEDFTYGYATINKVNLDGITNITVREGDRVFTEDRSGAPYTFSVEENSNSVTINWYFPPTQGTHTYTFGYTVEGGTRVEDSGDQVLWMAIPQDVPGRIDNSTVTINTPPNVPILATSAAINDIENDGVSTFISSDGRRATFQTTRSLYDDELVTGVRFEHGLLNIPVPDWQPNEAQQNALNLFFLVAGLMVLVGGPLLVLALWYSRGRDPEVGVYADYLPQPPSDLPPGIVGTLIDEKVDMHDVVSTIVDLARRGYIIINEEKRDHIYIRTDESTKNLRAYEVLLLQKLFGKKKERKLSDLRYNFSSALPALHAAMYKELEAEGFVPVSPQAVRTRYGCFTGIAVIVGSALVFIPGILTGADLAFCIGLGFLPTILALAVAGRHMPRKTELGALEASKWVAFKNYLNHIEDYTDLKEATAIFDRYLPYAVAFGLQTSWINKFSRIDTTPIPTWYGPIGYPRPIHMGGGSRPMTAGTGGSVSMPSLEGMSQSMTGGLEGMSKGLTRMLTSTSTILESTRSTSSSTGGSGGFSGGFSGGSSGGGSRGFG